MSDDASDRLGLLFELTRYQKYQRGFAFCSIGLPGLTETTPIGTPVGRCQRGHVRNPAAEWVLATRFKPVLSQKALLICSAKPCLKCYPRRSLKAVQSVVNSFFTESGCTPDSRIRRMSSRVRPNGSLDKSSISAWHSAIQRTWSSNLRRIHPAMTSLGVSR